MSKNFWVRNDASDFMTMAEKYEEEIKTIKKQHAKQIENMEEAYRVLWDRIEKTELLPKNKSRWQRFKDWLCPLLPNDAFDHHGN